MFVIKRYSAIERHEQSARAKEGAALGQVGDILKNLVRSIIIHM
jgi:hypothetical protein